MNNIHKPRTTPRLQRRRGLGGASITGKILGALSAVKGVDRVIPRSGNDWRSPNRLLTGRISKLGSTRVISVSVARSQSGAVLYNKTITTPVAVTGSRHFPGRER